MGKIPDHGFIHFAPENLPAWAGTALFCIQRLFFQIFGVTKESDNRLFYIFVIVYD